MHRGPGSVVGTGTGYGQEDPRIESRWRRDIPPVKTGPGAHPASCTMGTGSLPGVKYGRRLLLATHLLPVSPSWKSRAIPLLPLWATSGAIKGKIYVFYIYCSVHRNILWNNQQMSQCAVKFISLQVHSTCFGRHTRPSSGVQF